MRKAFTLIELLAVIFIIVLLASIIIPTMRYAKDYARRVVCLNNQRQLAIATHAYVMTYNEYLPLGATQYETPQTAAIGKIGPPTWDQRLWPYLETDYRIFACPTVSMSLENRNDLIPRTYTINAIITGLDNLNALFSYTRSMRLSEIHQPSITFLYGEHFWPSWTGSVGSAVFHNWSLIRPIHMVHYGTRIFETPWDPEGAHEAFGITNFTFVDGHTESLTTQYTKKEGDPIQGVKFHP
jgi:prepilin-type N-terminal cleavage/methylation domain-containing protein